jgi:hypothetical protein
MSEVFDAFWRAVAYALHPKVLLWSLLPLLLAGAAVFAGGWFFWEDAVSAMRTSLESWSLVEAMLTWLDAVGGQAFRAVIAPLLVVALTLPLIVVATLLLVAWLMTPALVGRVVRRRFPRLERRNGGGAAWQGVLWSLGWAAVAVLALLVTLPLWLVPPLALVLPALIWGWLAARVLAFDTLAGHADTDERRRILLEARWPLLAMGVAAGVLGSLPSLLWLLAGAASVIFAPLVLVAAVALYTMIFAFSTLWFAHFTLARLHMLRTGTLSSPP